MTQSDNVEDFSHIAEGAKEDKAGWSSFLKHLKECGLSGVEFVISDACLGLVESKDLQIPCCGGDV